jgi:hypothetical protein
MVPHERSLVKRLEDRPFALLGVNVDSSPDVLARAQEKHEITWRSWWDGGKRIAFKYGVRGYPTLFLINHDGIIRRKYVGRPPDSELERDVMQVIGEAVADAKSKMANDSRLPAEETP